MSAAEKTSPPTVLDADKLIDEILAAKGPHRYKNGLTEDNWEEASACFEMTQLFIIIIIVSCLLVRN